MFDPVDLARESVYLHVSGRAAPVVPANTPAEFLRPAGAFVSLKMGGRLRGCIGTFLPTKETLAQEIIQNAVGSATRDRRFAPVTLAELDDVVFSVDILSPPESVSGVRELDCKKYGVIVRAGSRRGLLLPDIEGIESVEEQVSIAKKKAGIGVDQAVELARFWVTRYK